jgi:restriction system protein
MYSLVAKEFNLTEEDRAELLPSGTARKFENRVAWTITYLSKARLLDRVARGVFQFRERGQVPEEPTELNNKFLRKFPSSLNLREDTGSI